MAEPPEDFEPLISGYLDGELDAEQRAAFEARVQQDAALRHELEAMKRLYVGTAALCTVDEPPPETWDRFLDGVYNRLERKTGWVVLVVGLLLVLAYGVYAFITTPWLTAMVKVLIAIPVAGMAILFLSVLRQRIRATRTDRYTREVRW